MIVGVVRDVPRAGRLSCHPTNSVKALKRKAGGGELVIQLTDVRSRLPVLQERSSPEEQAARSPFRRMRSASSATQNINRFLCAFCVPVRVVSIAEKFAPTGCRANFFVNLNDCRTDSQNAHALRYQLTGIDDGLICSII